MQTLFYKDYAAERRRVYFQLFDPADGVTPETGEAGGQPSAYSFGAGAAITTDVGVLVATNATHGAYYSELGQNCAILAQLGRHRVIYDTAATGPAEEIVEVVPHPFLHDGTLQAGGPVSATLAAGASAVNDIYNDAYLEVIDGTGAGQIRQITDYDGTTKEATVDQPWATEPDATSKYVITPGSRLSSLDEVWDSLTSDHTVGGSFGEALQPIRRGTAQAGAVNTITLDALASAVNDFYNGLIVRILGGTGAGQAAIISDYVGATKVATVGQNWATQPDNSSVFALYHLGVIPGASAPTAPQVAAAVWDELRAGHVIDGSFGAGVLLATGVASLIADAFIARNISGGSDGFPTIEFALCFLAGKWTDDENGTITVRSADDTTILGTISYTTRARDAIAGIDSAAP